MSGSSPDVALSFDDILSAVKDTARGRWFLESFESRLRNGNLTRVLEAIARLEERVEHFSHHSEDSQLVQKAREAIAAARRDIAQLENKPVHLSTEAQLFARLASQAKEAFGQPGQERPGIARALTLVDDLDREFNPQFQTEAQPGAPEASATDLFQPDEAIFEAAPKAAPAPTAAPAAPASAAAEPARETAPRGAKVVFHKTHVAPPEPAPVVVETPAEPEAETPAHNRIVMVRRGPSDAADVPLLEEASSTAA